jgi:hypothetical protein
LREGFPVYAAYQARRVFACERSPASGAAALDLAWKALKIASPAERALVARMFLQGPVRALRLNPA